MWWRTINTLACLTSSYLYAYMAAYESAKESETLILITLVYEVIFLISLLTQFLVEYTEPGQLTPEKDVMKIAKKYLNT